MLTPSSVGVGATLRESMGAPFPDHFSSVSSVYASARPSYPPALFDALAGLARARDLAWDAATGTGQAARELAERFDRVVATDASPHQVAAATPHPRITYRAARAEEPPAEARGAALVTCAQALHWLDLEAFYAGVRSILAPGGLLAAWGYGTHSTDDTAVDRLFDAFNATLHEQGFWPKERLVVESGYATMPFPFERVALPAFEMAVTWDLPALAAYVGTWSGVSALRKAGRGAALEAFLGRVASVWGDSRSTRRVTWPLSVLAGR